MFTKLGFAGLGLAGLSLVFDWGIALNALYVGLALLGLGRVLDHKI
jgi:hypothetical protein